MTFGDRLTFRNLPITLSFSLALATMLQGCGAGGNSVENPSGPISVTLSPNLGGATITQQIQLTATVTNDVGAAGVTWSVSSGGTLTGRRQPWPHSARQLPGFIPSRQRA